MDGGSGPWIKSTGEIGSIDRRCEGWRRSVRHSRNSLKKSIKPFDLSVRTGTPGIPFLPSLPRSKTYDPPRSRNKRICDTFTREERKWITEGSIWILTYCPTLKSARNIVELILFQLIITVRLWETWLEAVIFNTTSNRYLMYKESLLIYINLTQ